MQGDEGGRAMEGWTGRRQRASRTGKSNNKKKDMTKNCRINPKKRKESRKKKKEIIRRGLGALLARDDGWVRWMKIPLVPIPMGWMVWWQMRWRSVMGGGEGQGSVSRCSWPLVNFPGPYNERCYL